MAASTNEARDKLGQLSTLLEHFNKASTNTGLSVSNVITYGFRQLTGHHGKMNYTPQELLRR
jgi:hypothetical protein